MHLIQWFGRISQRVRNTGFILHVLTHSHTQSHTHSLTQSHTLTHNHSFSHPLTHSDSTLCFPTKSSEEEGRECKKFTNYSELKAALVKKWKPYFQLEIRWFCGCFDKSELCVPACFSSYLYRIEHFRFRFYILSKHKRKLTTSRNS